MAASNKNAWSKVIGRAWADQDFLNRLIASPSVVLAEYGLTYPESTVVVEDENAKIGDWRTEGEGDAKHIVIPIPPTPPSFDSEISDSQLSAAAGGSSKSSSHSIPSVPTCASPTTPKPSSSDSSDSSDASDASDGCTCSTCL